MFRPASAWAIIDPLAINRQSIKTIGRNTNNGFFYLVGFEPSSGNYGLVIRIVILLFGPNPFSSAIH
jgi:hypothetical protein